MTDELPDQLTRAAREHHAPGDVPREEIWARIGAARRAGPAPLRIVPPRKVPLVRWLVPVVGIAAALALAFGIGRMSVIPLGAPAPAVAAATGQPSVALTVAAAQHLSRVETFLTTLRTSPDQNEFGSLARDLLITTRLLLDSRVVADPRMATLLQDLELILVQIVQLDPTGPDLDLVTEGLEERQVLPRLRTAIPAGTPRSL